MGHLDCSFRLRRSGYLVSGVPFSISLEESVFVLVFWPLAISCLGKSSKAGLWSEGTKIGSVLGGASVSTLLGLAASSVGIISCESPAYSILLEFLFPLTIPLLLFRADFRRVIGTIVGTVLAYRMVPMQGLSQDISSSILAALAAGQMGGAVNYFVTMDVLHVPLSVLALGLAARNVIGAVYFASLFALASKLPPDHESSTSTNGAAVEGGSDESGDKLSVLQTATALVVSFAICKAGSYITEFLHIPALILPTITVTAVILATAFPTQFNHLAPSGEALAVILMQVFSAMVGARGNIWKVINTEPGILMFVLVQIACHLAVILGLGKLFRFDQKLLLIASNANVGGHTTAYGMAAAKEWIPTSLLLSPHPRCLSLTSAET
ncbi:unnamed protein product [Dovyalis caffra]|uniref:PIN-like protein n=1 Tax=Dovyalis caffra TaxID=77055 RepID=A0AAV1RTI9_9ROSI|nr:unnamed protein product [Dovyalis caffra]